VPLTVTPHALYITHKSYHKTAFPLPYRLVLSGPSRYA
jgi:hypothetical protein